MWLRWSKPFWDPIFGVGEFTTLLGTYFSGDWDVHWYGLLTHGHVTAWSLQVCPTNLSRHVQLEQLVSYLAC